MANARANVIVYAVAASNAAVSDPANARKLGDASTYVSVVGLMAGIATIVAVVCVVTMDDSTETSTT